MQSDDLPVEEHNSFNVVSQRAFVLAWRISPLQHAANSLEFTFELAELVCPVLVGFQKHRHVVVSQASSVVIVQVAPHGAILENGDEYPDNLPDALATVEL